MLISLSQFKTTIRPKISKDIKYLNISVMWIWLIDIETTELQMPITVTEHIRLPRNTQEVYSDEKDMKKNMFKERWQGQHNNLFKKIDIL